MDGVLCRAISAWQGCEVVSTPASVAARTGPAAPALPPISRAPEVPIGPGPLPCLLAFLSRPQYQTGSFFEFPTEKVPTEDQTLKNET